MTEEEIWQQLEAKQNQIKLKDEQFEAVLAAQQFVDACGASELSIMTLRKAVEMGFRRGRM